MHFVKINSKEKRSNLFSNLKWKTFRFSGAYNALVAKLIKDIGFDGYMSLGALYQMIWVCQILD